MTPEEARRVQHAAAVCVAFMNDDDEAIAVLAGAPPSAFELLGRMVRQTGEAIAGRVDWSEELAVQHPVSRCLRLLDRLAALTDRPALLWAEAFALGAARET